MPSVATAPSTQPVFVNAEAPKPCQVTVGALVYQPFWPFGLAGATCAQTKPVPFRPGPVIFGLLVVLAPPVGYAVSNHCGKNWSSRCVARRARRRQPVAEGRLELRLGDVAAAVGALDLLHHADPSRLSERRAQREVGGARTGVRVRRREQAADRRVRRRRRPERRARRPVVRVEPVVQARVERGVAGRRAEPARGDRRGARRGQVLADRRPAFLPEGEVEGGLGDVVAEPLVHVLVVERPRSRRPPIEPPAKVILPCISSSKLADGVPTTIPSVVSGHGPLNSLLEVDDVFLVVHRRLVGGLLGRRDRAGLRLPVLDARASGSSAQ